MKWSEILSLLAISLLLIICAEKAFFIEKKSEAKAELVHEQEVEVISPELWPMSEPECTEVKTLCEKHQLFYYRHYSNGSWIPSCCPVCDIDEPNEPEYTEEELTEIYKDEPALAQLAKWLYGYETQTTFYYNITHFIPTWPKYIELDNDLMIESFMMMDGYDGCVVVPKGTKIYFRKEE
jgi:hypothetical protein